MQITGKWIGAKEVEAAFKRLPADVRFDVQGVIDVSAFQMARDAQHRVRKRTGWLASLIEWQSRPRSLSAVIGIGFLGWYWKFLEYGTVKMTAKPFLRPAAEAIYVDHVSRMESALSRANSQLRAA